MKKENETLKETLKTKDHQIADLEGTIDDLQSRVDEQRKMINAKQDAVRAIDKNLGEARTAKDVLETRVSELESELEEFQQRESVTERRLVEFQYQVQGWEDNCTTIRTANTGNVRRCEELERQISSEKQKYAELVSENEQLEQERSALNAKIEGHDDAIVAFEAQIASRDKKSTEARKDLEETKAALQKLKDNFDAAESEKKSIEKQLDQAIDVSGL